MLLDWEVVSREEPPRSVTLAGEFVYSGFTVNASAKEELENELKSSEVE